MKKRKWFLFIVFIILLIDIHAEFTKELDHIYLIDTSGSMSGANNNPNIFPKVKESIMNNIDGLYEDCNVAIFTFNEGIIDSLFMEIDNSSSKNKLKSKINNLTATGNFTYLYDSIEYILNYAKRINKKNDKIQSILIFTDGQDNSPSNLTFDSVLEKFKLMKAENDGFLYARYYSLGVDPPVYTNLPPDFVIEPYAENTVPPLIEIGIRPHYKHFGNMFKIQQSERTFHFDFNKSIAVSLLPTIYPSVSFPELEKKGVTTLIYPDKIGLDSNMQKIKLSIRDYDPSIVIQKNYQGILSFESDNNIIIIPKSIPIEITFEEESIIEILPGKGNELNLEIGKLSLKKNRFVHHLPLRVKFNKVSADKKINFLFDLIQDSGNPSLLDLGEDIAIRMQGFDKQYHNIIASNKILEMELIFNIPHNIQHGKYNGTIKIKSESKNALEIIHYSETKIDTLYENQQLPFSFTIPMIISWWIWLIMTIVIILLLFIMYCIFISPKFSKSYTLTDNTGIIIDLYRHNKFCATQISVGGPDSDIELIGLSDIMFYLKPVSKNLVKVISNSDVSVNGISCTKGQTTILLEDSSNKIEFESFDNKIEIKQTLLI